MKELRHLGRRAAGAPGEYVAHLGFGLRLGRVLRPDPVRASIMAPNTVRGRSFGNRAARASARWARTIWAASKHTSATIAHGRSSLRQVHRTAPSVPGHMAQWCSSRRGARSCGRGPWGFQRRSLERVPSRAQPIYRNRAGWAHDRLKRAVLCASPRRGYWQITEQGRDYVSHQLASLSLAEAEQLAVGLMDVRLRGPTTEDVSAPIEVSKAQVAASTTASPDDRLAEALSEPRSCVAAELLDTLATVSPSAF